MIDDTEMVARLRDAHEHAPVILTDPAPVIAAARRRRRRHAAARAAGGLAVVVAVLVTTVVAGPWGAGLPAPFADRAEEAPDGTGWGPVQGGADPVGLVGLWEVEADGEEPGALLWLGGEHGWPELVLRRECGEIFGAWLAGRAAFAGHVNGWSEPCVEAGGGAALEPTGQPGWLAAAVGYEPDGQGWMLTDAAGDPVATLSPGGPVETTDRHAGRAAVPPVLTDELIETLAGPLSPPTWLEPATAQTLLGRWVPVAGGNGWDPFAQFALEGTWSGSDGCNGTNGRWAVEAGRLLTTSGDSTLIGCDSVPVNGWVSLAEYAGFDGEELVLVDGEGAELGRLVRDGSPLPQNEPDPAPTSPDPDATEAPDQARAGPLGLVGAWEVEADGSSPGAVLWLGEFYGNLRLAVVRECGTAPGGWRAGDTTFVGAISSYPGSCPGAHDGVSEWEASWLESVVAYAPDGAGWELLNAQGDRVATLSPTTTIPQPVYREEPFMAPPVMSDALVTALTRPVPPPGGLVPATVETLVGRWVTEDPQVGAYVQFDANGQWVGSSCNDARGRWAVEDGRLAAVVSASDMCAVRFDMTDWLPSTSYAGFDGDELVLVRADGSELRLVRG